MGECNPSIRAQRAIRNSETPPEIKKLKDRLTTAWEP